MSQSDSQSPSDPPRTETRDLDARDLNARYQKALSFLYDRINYEKMASGTARYPFRLHRTGELLRELGLDGFLAECVDQPQIPIVHIAGTKGKGSTGSMVASILTASGMVTGLYTSPHLNDLEERFRIDGQPCSREQLADLVEEIAPVAQKFADQGHGDPSFFELTTAIGLLHFQKQKCDAIVLEVGLGGRLDSTNVCMSSVSAITSIGLDHQHVLGNTLAEIAAEKAGIIKPGVPLVSGVRGGEAAEVIAAKATKARANLFQLGKDFDFQCQPDSQWGSTLDYRVIPQVAPLKETTDRPLDPDTNMSQVELGLDGEHQAHNAAVAITIARQLQLRILRDSSKTPPHTINEQAIRDGLQNVRCPGRVERFCLANGITAIVDAAHNDDSIAALCRCIEQRRGDQKVAVVFGTSRDKSADSMLKLLAPAADLLVLTQFEGNPRYRPTDDLLPLVPPSATRNTVVQRTPIEACQAGIDFLGSGGTLVICGSFFLAAETRPWVESLSNETSH
ncbi:bifunctional folylpolyglutamate synthase/dihydrofolate synthase [Planctomycetes bacterium K23_9]|uniref:Dihydrofolate synthase/folylpolyglutamate synthase n=1 Tax=Stieleria marina TaxID=1930275 RepID=A0A517P1G5_9BACT|nr:Folylpolyglutamate synthase [Planctomycetes bacterium K23_9]